MIVGLLLGIFAEERDQVFVICGIGKDTQACST